MAMIEINKNPSRRDLAWFGVLVLIFFGLIGALARWRFGSADTGNNLWLVGAGLCLVYYAIPPIRKWMMLGWMYAAFPIGWTISHILLGVTFYLVLTPIGLIMRLLGREPLQLSFEPDKASYWVEHDPGEDASRYFRQY